MEKIKLNYYQVMCFMYRIYEIGLMEKIKENEILGEFILRFISKSITMFMSSPVVLHEVLKKLKIFEISLGKFNYLVNLTYINPVNKDVLEDYINKIKIANFELEFLGKTPEEVRQIVKKVDNEQKQVLKNYTRKLKKQSRKDRKIKN